MSIWIVAGLILIAILLSWGKLGGSMRNSRPTPPEQASTVPESVVERVARHIAIIVGEEPTIATIQDPEILRQQNPDFYRDAKVGDRLLIWSDKAVLYSEADDLIISVLPVSSIPQQVQASSTGSSEQIISDEMRQGIDSISIEVRNGTWTPGLGKMMSDALTEKGWLVLKPRDAGVKGYEKTIIAIQNLNASTTEYVDILASDIGAEIVDNIPSSENTVKGDILVIVGSDSVQEP